MEEIQLEACLILISLITLIRNLSYEPTHGWIDKHAVKALVDYFVPALISRPYRPGYLTKEDKGCRTALCYLCHNLPEIRALCKRPEIHNNVHLIFDSSSGTSILELHKSRGTSPIVKKVISEDLKTPLSKTESLHSEKLCTNSGTYPAVKKAISEDLIITVSKTESLDSGKLNDNGGTSPGVKKLISEDLKISLSKKDSPDTRNLQPAAFLMPKNLSTPKKSSKDCKKEEVQRKCTAIGSPTILETRDVEESKGTPMDFKLINGNSEEKEVVTNLKSDKGTNSEDSLLALPFEDEGQTKNAAVDEMGYTVGNDKSATECSPEKKCQAIKLAYKLRGQWLAWKLAGHFLDGATSHISGLGYTKLPDDALCLVNK